MYTRKFVFILILLDVIFQADPIDAGTDNGFTFTSPNWPTVPKAAVFRITNVYPSHPAGSFWYPDKDVLPSIASFTFLKVINYDHCSILEFQNNTYNFVEKRNIFSKNIFPVGTGIRVE